jgi:hypothetical protein
MYNPVLLYLSLAVDSSPSLQDSAQYDRPNKDARCRPTEVLVEGPSSQQHQPPDQPTTGLAQVKQEHASDEEEEEEEEGDVETGRHGDVDYSSNVLYKNKHAENQVSRSNMVGKKLVNHLVEQNQNKQTVIRSNRRKSGRHSPRAEHGFSQRAEMEGYSQRAEIERYSRIYHGYSFKQFTLRHNFTKLRHKTGIL